MSQTIRRDGNGNGNNSWLLHAEKQNNSEPQTLSRDTINFRKTNGGNSWDVKSTVNSFVCIDSNHFGQS